MISPTNSFYIFESPIGSLLAIADATHLKRLQFIAYEQLDHHIAKEQQLMKSILIQEKNALLAQLEKELTEYFQGTLKNFSVPLFLEGTNFQKIVWQKLQEIPYGITQSYKGLAHAVGNSLACRAVAKANSQNKFIIVVPCHRIINSSGMLGGYASGIERKHWLLEHEQKFIA